MDKNQKKRISVSLNRSSLALKKFIEKCLKDDEFFTQSMKNPFQSLSSCGVPIDKNVFKPDDFATFFGAMSRLKETIKKRMPEEITFETIFGKSAEINGSSEQSQQSVVWNLQETDTLVNREAQIYADQQSFEQDGALNRQNDNLYGPLVNPAELEVIAARIDVYIGKISAASTRINKLSDKRGPASPK